MNSVQEILVVVTLSLISIALITIADSDLDDLQDFDFENDLLVDDANNQVPESDQLWNIDDVDEQPAVSFVEKEKRVRDALARITMNPNNRQTMTQILPILRSLSTAQRTTLAAIVMAQASQHDGNELNYEQVS